VAVIASCARLRWLAVSGAARNGSHARQVRGRLGRASPRLTGRTTKNAPQLQRGGNAPDQGEGSADDLAHGGRLVGELLGHHA
jgi:hypothetical protein